jgi:uncharacterized protein (DUF488 family)
MTDQESLWTIGHSNHSIECFLELLRSNQIDVVVDVRSQPYSSYQGHFSQAPLRRSLEGAGFRYLFLGKELGGRPPEPELYDDEDHVLYGELAKTERFSRGLDRLIKGTAAYRVAMMCSEEDPSDCHRRLLITRALEESDAPVTVTHIRGTGELVDESQLSRDTDGRKQQTFFEDEAPWRSAQSVSPSTQRKASLAS